VVMLLSRSRQCGRRVRGRGARGVALIDAIVAAVVLGIALTVIIGLTARAIGSQSQGERLQTAAMLADEQLNLVLMRGGDDYAKRFMTTGPCDVPFQQYQYQTDITGGQGGEPYTVKVTISWTEPSGRSDKVTIETFIAPKVGSDPDPKRAPATAPERLQ
jgi:Tfp pilus assembly protein PilV